MSSPRRQISTGALPPFQTLIREYLWTRRPPMGMTQFAHQVGLSPTTVYGWFDEPRVPSVPTLQRIAEHTDIPLAALYRACGYAVPEPPAPQPAAASRLWDSFYAWARDYDDLSPRARHDLIEFLKGWQRGQYDQFAAQREAEQHVVEVQSPSLTDAQSHATLQRDQATNTQPGTPDRMPEQATRIARKRRKDVAHTARRPSVLQSGK